MSKGPRPPSNNPSIRPQGPDMEIDLQPEECWNFRLIETTEAVRELKRGSQITGSIHSGQRVLVSASGNALGFAPVAVSKIIIAVAERTSGSLYGQVLSVENTNVTVKLCINI